jgi:hypothetical protein
VQRGICETGKLINLNDCPITSDNQPNELLEVMQSSVESIDLKTNIKSVLFPEKLKTTSYQIRFFSVPDGPLSISVSGGYDENVPFQSGLTVVEVDDFNYFAPGDIITAVNNIKLSNMYLELATNIFSRSVGRKLTVIRGYCDNCLHNKMTDRDNIIEGKQHFNDPVINDYYKKMLLKYS